MDLIIKLLETVVAPFVTQPVAPPLQLVPPAIHREAPRDLRQAVPLPRPFPTCAIVIKQPPTMLASGEHDPFASAGRHCRDRQDAMRFVG